jgi:hypothetical protein
MSDSRIPGPNKGRVRAKTGRVRLDTTVVVFVAWLGGLVVSSSADGTSSPIRFENVSAESGLTFVLDQHATPEKNMVETMAGGVAVFDYDGDGLADIYFTNGASIPSLRK